MDTFVFLQNTIDRSIEYSAGMTFNKTNRQHFLLICLYMRIIELSHSCAILMKNRIISGVPILLRTVIETFADFRSLSKDGNHSNVMLASYDKEWLRLYEEAIEGTNPYLGKISQMANVQKTYEETKTQLDDLRNKGYLALTHRQRFDKAGMTSEYLSIYNKLCSHSHSNIRSLLDRHTQIEGNDFKVMFFKEPERREIELYSIDLCDRVVEASLTIHNFFDSRLFSKIEAIHKEWESLKEAIIKETDER